MLLLMISVINTYLHAFIKYNCSELTCSLYAGPLKLYKFALLAYSLLGTLSLSRRVVKHRGSESTLLRLTTDRYTPGYKALATQLAYSTQYELSCMCIQYIIAGLVIL